MSDADHDPPPEETAAGKRLAELARKFMRCPTCRRAVHREPGGVCPECGVAPWAGFWEKATISAPVQVEELNGGVCRKCGEPVTILPPKRHAAFAGAAVGGGIVFLLLGPVLTSRSDLGLAVFILVVLAMGAPAVFLAVRFRRVRLLNTCIVVCDGCGRVNIGGGADPENARRFRRGRAAVVGARRLLLPALYFLVAVTAWEILTGSIPPPATLLALGFVGLAVLYNASLKRAFLPPARNWWEIVRPW
jgi:hypothetical protein